MTSRTATVIPTATSALTPFLGREHEITEVMALLTDRRLVTLTGAGGVGKTRLGIEVADRVAATHRDGVAIVDLAPLSSPSLVRTAVSAAVGRPGLEDDHGLLAHLNGRDILIVLDNCEHLVDVCAHLAVDVLRNCPDVGILATSRRPLGIAVETTYQVPPLSLPNDAASIGTSEAVGFFVERAGHVRPGFELTPANAAPIAAICTRLDGLPLCLELAATRLRAFSVQEVEAQLVDRLQFLTRGDRTAAPRQRTLRHLLDWSFELLSEREKLLFRRLGAFSGGATLEAITEVCTDDLLPPKEVPQLVAELVDHSLLVLREQDGHPRLHLLETIAEYARDRLAETGEERWLADRHLDRFTRWAGRLRAERFSSDQVADLRRLSAELPNVLRALDHAIEHDPPRGIGLAAALEILWLVGGHLTEGRDRLEHLLRAAGDVPEDIHRSALRVSGRILFVAGELEVAGDRLGQALELARRSGDRQETAELLQLTGQVLEAEGRTEEARSVAAEALAIIREDVPETGVDDAMANRLRWTLSTLADAMRDSGDRDEAQQLYEEALDLARGHPDRHDEAMIQTSLAALALDRGDPATATVLLAGALDIQQELGDRNCLARTHELLARVDGVGGRPGRHVHLARALRLRVELGQIGEAVRTLEDLVDALEQHDPLRGGRLAALADRIRTRPGDRRYLEQALAVVSDEEHHGSVPPLPEPEPVPQEERFVREGQFWSVEFEGRTVRLRDTKGMRYLAVLLERPWDEVHVLELAAPPTGTRDAGVELSVRRGGDAGPLLDERARREYQRRIQELHDDIDEADRFRDDERAARSREELDLLVHELSAAFGLGGRPRKGADDAERARKAVFNRIRAAMATIAADHPPLGAHLERAVHTGLFCSYCPDRPVVWEMSPST